MAGPLPPGAHTIIATPEEARENLLMVLLDGKRLAPRGRLSYNEIVTESHDRFKINPPPGKHYIQAHTLVQALTKLVNDGLVLTSGLWSWQRWRLSEAGVIQAQQVNEDYRQQLHARINKPSPPFVVDPPASESEPEVQVAPMPPTPRSRLSGLAERLQ